VRVRGKLAYVHVKQLKDMDLINDERIGRTRMLRTTSTFADYFNLNHDPSLLKKELKKVLQVAEEVPVSGQTDTPES
jgi:segregation and condensation protein B